MFGFVRVHISLYADFDIEFNSLSEDHQDFALEDETHNVSEIHSFVSSEDMSFQILIEEVLKLLRAQTKQMRFWEGTGCDLPLLWNVESHKEKYFFVTIKLSFD